MNDYEILATIVQNPEFDYLTPGELLEEHDNRNRQIDAIKRIWTALNREQTKILMLYYQITEEQTE